MIVTTILLIFILASGGLLAFVLTLGSKTPSASQVALDPQKPVAPPVTLPPQKPLAPRAPLAPGVGVVRKDPDKVKVEKWLKENLDSGKWEEITWWGTDKYDGPEWTDNPGDQVCGIKLRTRTKSGGMAVQGYMLIISNDTVSVLRQETDNPSNIDVLIGPLPN